jgi:hypothetical protein
MHVILTKLVGYKMWSEKLSAIRYLGRTRNLSSFCRTTIIDNYFRSTFRLTTDKVFASRQINRSVSTLIMNLCLAV